MIFRNKRSKVTGHNETKSPFASFHNIAITPVFETISLWMNTKLYVLGHGVGSRTWAFLNGWLYRGEGALQEGGRLKGSAVAGEAPDDLHAER